MQDFVRMQALEESNISNQLRSHAYTLPDQEHSSTLALSEYSSQFMSPYDVCVHGEDNECLGFNYKTLRDSCEAMRFAFLRGALHFRYECHCNQLQSRLIFP